jgi:hypothetical protein
MQEVWKQYRDTQYSVANTGYVRNDTTGKILSGARTRQGYLRFNMWHKGTSTSVAIHRLIAEVFLGKPENENYVVNHKDGNPSNNRLDNLEWVTIKDNVRHAYATGLAKSGEDSAAAKLTEAEVLQIIDCMRSGMTVSQTAKDFKISAAAVSNIWHGNTWKHLKRELPSTKNYQGKLKAEDIPVIRSMFDSHTNLQIAKKFGVHPASIYNIRSGKNWSNY